MTEMFVKMAAAVIVVCGLAAALEPAEAIYPILMGAVVLWSMYRVLKGMGG